MVLGTLPETARSARKRISRSAMTNRWNVGRKLTVARRILEYLSTALVRRVQANLTLRLCAVYLYRIIPGLSGSAACVDVSGRSRVTYIERARKPAIVENLQITRNVGSGTCIVSKSSAVNRGNRMSRTGYGSVNLALSPRCVHREKRKKNTSDSFTDLVRFRNRAPLPYSE